MKILSLSTLSVALTLALAACGPADVKTITAPRDDYGPPPARRGLDKVQIAAENGFVVARERPAPSVGAAWATARFHLGGVDCGSCAPTVALALGQLAGVREARVSQTVPEATVEFDPARLTARQVLGAIARTGLHPKQEQP